MNIERLDAAQVFGLLERSMRRVSSWNASERADAVFVETASNFLSILGGSEVSIYLDDPATKQFEKKSKVELVCVASSSLLQKAGRKLEKKERIVGRRFRLGSDTVSLSYRTARIQRVSIRDSLLVCFPVRIGKSIVGVIQVFFSKDNITKHQIREGEMLCRYFSASLQNVLDAQKRVELERRDSLTGLASGRELEDYLRAQVDRCFLQKRQRDLVVLFIDLDYFKRINDTWGHIVGSRLLVEMANLLRRCVIHPEHFIARFGGDEFVVVLVGASVSEAEQVAERIRREIIRKKKVFRGVTMSVGLASLHVHVRRRDHRLLLRFADQAMYVAKHSGRNKTVVYGVEGEEGKKNE